MVKKIYKFYKTKKNNSLKKTKKYKIQNGSGPKMYQIPSGPDVKKKSKIVKGLATAWALGKTGVKELLKTSVYTPVNMLGTWGFRQDGSFAGFVGRKSLAAQNMDLHSPALKQILKKTVLRKDTKTPYTSNEINIIQKYLQQPIHNSKSTTRTYIKSKESFFNKVKRARNETLYGKKTLYGNTGKYDVRAVLEKIVLDTPLSINKSQNQAAVQTPF
jgi:hypothetical protein